MFLNSYHVGRYHNGEVTGSHFVLFTICCHQVKELQTRYWRSCFKPRIEENLEQVLDILVILSWQVLMLKKVPDSIKFIVPLLGVSEDKNSVSIKRYNYRRICVDLMVHNFQGA